MAHAFKVALVTGSGKRRVGWHVAQALADRGYALAIHYHFSADEAHETVAELRERGVQAEAYAADVAREDEVQRLVDQTLSAFGRIDALVTCAAVWWPKPLETITAADLRTFLDVNTLGTFLCCQRAGLAMVGQKEGGSIVTVGDWAIARPYLDYAAYFPSKGAIPAMTRSLAAEFGRRNPKVRVNCVLPGPVMLPPEMSESEKRRAISATLVKHEGRPDNVAQAVVHFIENDFITGACLAVDGGRSIYSVDSDIEA